MNFAKLVLEIIQLKFSMVVWGRGGGGGVEENNKNNKKIQVGGWQFSPPQIICQTCL